MFFDRLNGSFIRSYVYLKYLIKNRINPFGGPGMPFGLEPSILAPLGPNNLVQRLMSNPFGSGSPSQQESPSLLDSIFFAVPKQRKTIEKRLQSRFGDDKWASGRKMLKRRLDLIVCDTCGNYREKVGLCVHCFNRVEAESESIKKAIAAQYGLYPLDKPWQIVYKDEPKDQVTDKILVEVDKPRPTWFTKSLLQRANEPIDEKSVVPPDT